MSDVMRGSQAPALLVVMVAIATFAGCGSAHKSESEKIVVSATGRIGPLHVDESNRADVISFAGRPESERRGRYGRFYRSYDALGYGCRGRPATDNAGVPRCKTVFYLDPRRGNLELLYTEDKRYADPHGVHPGMRTPVAEHRLRRHAFNGCFSGFRFDAKSGFLVMWLYGGTAIVGNDVGFLVVHSQHLNPGVFDCIDS
jgi:hypothetical protein